VSTVFKGEQTVFEINVDGDDYLASCRTMDVPLGKDTDLLPPQSITDYRSVVGTIGYASSEFRPDLAWEKSSLSRQFVTPTILDAKRANAALRYAQKNRVILKYRRGVENLTMFHDGSLGNLDDGKSQGGRIACLTNKTGNSVASWIFWESRTIKRVCRSPSASEFLSAVEGYDATMWLLVLWKEISEQDLDALLVTDSESLQQKAVDGFADGETASDRHGSASSKFASWRIRPGVGGFVEQPGESTDEGSSWHKSNNVG
jgi:hypothetical protein